MPKPQVIMFGWELPPYNSGGLGTACYGMAKGLSSLGVDLSFALPRRLPHKIPFLNLLNHTLQGVEITAINSLLAAYQTATSYDTQYSTLYHDYTPTYGYSIYEESHRFAKMASSWARTKKYNIVHSHDWMTYEAGMVAKKVSGAPFIAHVHATEFDRTGGACDTRIAEVEYQGLNAADQVIAVSEYTKDIIQKHYSVKPDKITVVHNGIDPVEFEGQDLKRVFPNDHIVLFVGRLTFQKGVEYFLRAAKQVLDVQPNTIFVIAGDGDQYQKHILEAAALGISQRVIFTGFVQGNPLHSIYKMADVFVMPSVSEPYGIVALEAVASGVPCIISKQSGVAESVKNVLSTDFWDVNRMASLINTLLLYPDLRNSLSISAKHELPNLSWHKAATKINRVYQSLL